MSELQITLNQVEVAIAEQSDLVDGLFNDGHRRLWETASLKLQSLQMIRRIAKQTGRCKHSPRGLGHQPSEAPVKVWATESLGMNGDYTVAIWATIGLTVLFTVPVVWQFLRPSDDDFGDITKRPK